MITSIYACSDVGVLRSNNEDNFIIADLKTNRYCAAPQSIKRDLVDNLLLLAVSDGMGGAQAGEIASALAVYGLRLELVSQKNNLAIAERLVQALEKINSLIWNGAQNEPSYRGMGATITAAIVEGTRAFIAEVGDSRAYIVRGNRIKQITTDQSLFEALVSSGIFKGEPPENAPARNIILQSLGGQQSVKVAINAIELQAGDYLLLCSDGLSNKLNADEMLKFVSKSTNLETACATMVSVAKKRGGEDNITVVLAKFEGEGLPIGSENSSITKSINIISVFNPLTGDVERKDRRHTQQMVSDRVEDESDKEDEVFRSTIGLLPLMEYPGRAKAIQESDRSIELLDDAGKQLSVVIDEVRKLELWIQQQGRLDPTLQKAIAHLEHAIKNSQKIASVARKARNVLERLSQKPED